jgi:hypothetical protein
VVFALATVPANAADVLVLNPDGRTFERFDPGVASIGPERPSPHLGVRTAATAAAVTPLTEFKRMFAAGQIDQAAYDNARGVYKDAVAFTRRLTGRRLLEMQGQLAVLGRIAAGGLLTPSRVAPLVLQLQRNREWWGKGPLLASGARVSFAGTQLVFQYFPGEGLQIHPLANFGKLNALWTSGRTNKMTALMNEELAIAAERAGGIAWEYYFDFDGGRPPWVSSLSQGTALQALARASSKAGVYDVVLPVIERGLTIFQTPPPVGVRTAADGGYHYVQYSFAPSLRILNGFIQALTGLYDFAKITGSPEAQQLFTQGDIAARKEVPTFDTGSWSLYSRGSITRESDLSYHQLLTLFLHNLCDRTGTPVYCDTAARFGDDEKVAPALTLLTTTVHRKRPNALQFKLSKISRVSLTLNRGGKTVYSYAATLGYGTRSVTVTPPAGAKAYAVRISATDLAGNTSSIAGTVKIVK